MKDIDTAASSRRTVLRFGAAAVPAFATLKASPAAAATSIMQCRIPLTTTETGSKWIYYDPSGSSTNNGTLVAANSTKSYPPLSASTGSYQAQELRDNYTGAKSTAQIISGKTMSNGSALTSTAYSAHTEYIKKLTYGKTGYSCYASIYTSLSS